ncbi:hypothetical protein BH11VER1_BH11VER1_25250 [soil metagenome]
MYYGNSTQPNYMKKLLTLLAVAALSSSAFAGSVSYSGKAGKAVQPIAPEVGCNAFESKLAFGVFGGAILPSDDGEDALGGGVLGEYFFTPYIGVQGSYGIYATDKEHHQFDGSIVLRYPITSLCIAPYILAGGGYSTNSEQGGDIHVGGGLEARFTSLNNLGVFADGAYHFSDNGDFTIVRLGVKFPL